MNWPKGENLRSWITFPFSTKYFYLSALFSLACLPSEWSNFWLLSFPSRGCFSPLPLTLQLLFLTWLPGDRLSRSINSLKRKDIPQTYFVLFAECFGIPVFPEPSILFAFGVTLGISADVLSGRSSEMHSPFSKGATVNLRRRIM